MKLRASACAVFISTLLPAALNEAGLPSAPFAEPEACAQADPVTEVARQRYEDGVKAYDAGRYEDARAAFLQAYALKRHPAVLLNLGQSEIRSGHAEDAGNHLQQFLREHKSATPEQRAAAEKGIAGAKRKTGFIIVIADATGADLSIDGTVVGKVPLLDPYFVKPGKHTVVASYQGKSATTQVDAKAGSAAAAQLTLGTSGAAPAPAPVRPAPAPGPTPAPVSPGPAPGEPATAPGPGPTASYPPDQGGFATVTTPGMGTTGPDQVQSGREPILQWYTRKPIAWAGTGVAGVGLIGGILFSALAADSSGRADFIASEINAEAAKNPGETGNRPNGPYCGPRDDPSGDLSHFSTACNQLRDELDAYDTKFALAVTSWVVFGVGVAGTVTYAMIDWYPKKTETAEGLHITAVAPVIGPQQTGLGIAGTF